MCPTTTKNDSMITLYKLTLCLRKWLDGFTKFKLLLIL